MNVITLQGGLGNQMFQYALGLRFREQGTMVLFDRTRVHTDYNGTHDRSRPAYGLDDFETDVQFIRPMDYRNANFNTYGTEQIKFEPEVLEMDNTVLSGYWQSEKYFPKYKELLLSEFSPRGHMPSHVVKLVQDIHSKRSIGIQVRRGDYLQFQQFHGVLDEQYFYDGLHVAGGGQEFVWTDDVLWCKEHFPTARIANTGFRAWDIFLMSMCDSIIISNSSFGWWGAWLGDFNKPKDGRRVIAPERWFATDKIDSKDVVPERWWKI